jgi:hypothetical protein
LGRSEPDCAVWTKRKEPFSPRLLGIGVASWAPTADRHPSAANAAAERPVPLFRRSAVRRDSRREANDLESMSKRLAPEYDLAA